MSIDDQILKNLPPLKFNFWKFRKSTKFVYQIRETAVCFSSAMYTKRKCSWKWKEGVKRLNTLVLKKKTKISQIFLYFHWWIF